MIRKRHVASSTSQHIFRYCPIATPPTATHGLERLRLGGLHYYSTAICATVSFPAMAGRSFAREEQTMSDVIEFPPEDDVPFDEDIAAALNEPVEAPAKVEIASEPLFSLLLKGAVDQGDLVLRDYAEHVAPRLSQYLG